MIKYAKKQGDLFEKCINLVASNNPSIKEIRCYGLNIFINTIGEDQCNRLYIHLLKHGIIGIPNPPYGVILKPSLIITGKHIN